MYIVQTSDTSTNSNTLDDQRIRCSQVTSPNPTQLTGATPTPTTYAQPCQATQRCTWPQYSTIQAATIPTQHRTKHAPHLPATSNTGNFQTTPKIVIQYI